MGFADIVKGIPGLTHYYPLATDAKDVVGTQHGVASGVTFSGGRAVFNGSASINLGDHNDFSVATAKGLTIACFLTIDNWKGAGASEYVHWAGKGKSGAHEWTFRHYVQGGTGEAPSREGRLSFYHFNPAGGLGAGSYFQDGTHPTTERMIAGRCDMTNVSLAVNGAIKDTDPLSGYKITPQNTASNFMLGTRGDSTGFLVGKIRRVAVFNRVLTASELTKLWDSRDLPENDPVPPPEAPTPSNPLYVDLTGDVTAMEVATAHNALVDALTLRGSI
jgi:hypothetical protein